MVNNEHSFDLIMSNENLETAVAEKEEEKKAILSSEAVLFQLKLGEHFLSINQNVRCKHHG